MITYLEEYEDGEIVGVDTDGNLMLWSRERQEPYNCGEGADGDYQRIVGGPLTDRELRNLSHQE